MLILNKIMMPLLLSIVSINCKTIDENPTIQTNEIEVKFDSLFKTLQDNGEFNGTVLVAKNEVILYQKALGFADGSKQNLLKTTDKFNIGSIYKEIPAIAIMQLEEKSLLHLNEPISKHIKNLPNWSNQVTILNLLQYTSGLPKINWMKHKEINDEFLLKDLIDTQNLEFTPGSSYLYTNYSPFLLSKIVESITNINFTEYVFQNILEPFSLNNSIFNASFPYENKESMAISFNSEFVEDNPPFTIKSPGFLFSTTAEDLYKLLKNLHSYKIISKESIHTIGSTAVLDIKDMESALGQVQFNTNEVTEHTHHGSSGNYESIMYKNKLDNTTIIILINTKNDNIHEIKSFIQLLL